MRPSKLSTLVLGSALVFGFSIQGPPLFLGAVEAQAKSGGNSDNGGNNGDHGNSGDHGKSGDHGGGGNHGKSGNPGNSGDQGSTKNDQDELGSLNAAHASETALSHASENSRVGQIALYEDSIDAGDIDAAAAALRAAANKPVTHRVIRQLNRQLGIVMTEAEVLALLHAVHHPGP
jgi:hypothetical protein